MFTNHPDLPPQSGNFDEDCGNFCGWLERRQQAVPSDQRYYLCWRWAGFLAFLLTLLALSLLDYFGVFNIWLGR